MTEEYEVEDEEVEDNFNFEDDLEFEINFDEVEELKPVPENTYFLACTSAKAGMSQAKNKKITLQWNIHEGDHEGRSIFDDMVFTKKALFKVKQAMLAMDFPPGFSGGINPDDFVGQTVKAIVTIQPGNGNDPVTGDPYPPRNRIRKYVKLSEDELELFA